MIKYVVRSENPLLGGWTHYYDSVHDAGIAVKAIKKANDCLEDHQKFHGGVTKWEAYELKDGQMKTISSEPVNGLDF